MRDRDIYTQTHHNKNVKTQRQGENPRRSQRNLVTCKRTSMRLTDDFSLETVEAGRQQGDILNAQRGENLTKNPISSKSIFQRR